MDGQTCELCGTENGRQLDIPQSPLKVCAGCATQLGHLIVEEPRLRLLFPALAEEDDNDEPEPWVRLSDGSKVQLRARTEEMKAGLTPEQRIQLSDDYVKLGLWREAILELAKVLRDGEVSDKGRALGQLLGAPLGNADTVDQLKPFLIRM